MVGRHSREITWAKRIGSEWLAREARPGEPDTKLINTCLIPPWICLWCRHFRSGPILYWSCLHSGHVTYCMGAHCTHFVNYLVYGFEETFDLCISGRQEFVIWGCLFSNHSCPAVSMHRPMFPKWKREYTLMLRTPLTTLLGLVTAQQKSENHINYKHRSWIRAKFYLHFWYIGPNSSMAYHNFIEFIVIKYIAGAIDFNGCTPWTNLGQYILNINRNDFMERGIWYNDNAAAKQMLYWWAIQLPYESFHFSL